MLIYDYSVGKIKHVNVKNAFNIYVIFKLKSSKEYLLQLHKNNVKYNVKEN